MSYLFTRDTSVTLSWLFTDEMNPETLQLRNELSNGKAIAPNLWPIEVANVLWVSEKKKRITPFQTSTFKRLLLKLPIEIDHKTSEFALRRNLELAREYKLTVYDSCYLELSLRYGCPLATLDKDFTRIEDINVYSPDDIV